MRKLETDLATFENILRVSGELGALGAEEGQEVIIFMYYYLSVKE
jgi:hypothetical protein